MSFSVLKDSFKTLKQWAPQLNSQFNALRENRNRFIINREIPIDILWVDEDGTERRGYRKTLFVASLPNATQVSVPHNIGNISQVVDVWGVASNGQLNLPLVFSNIEMYVTKDNLVISTSVNRTAYNAYFHIDFLK